MGRLEMPLVDLSTVNAVESLYHRGPRDPSARVLAGQLANMYAYADAIRYPLPVRTDRVPNLPRLLVALEACARRDSANSTVFSPVPFSTADRVVLQDEHLLPAFQQFVTWARANHSTLATILKLHSQPWLREGHFSRVQRTFIFDVERLRQPPELRAIVTLLKVSREMVYHAFDVALRYSLYGELAGPNQYYLNHPLRDALKLPTQTVTPSPPWKPCVSFAEDIERLAPHLSVDKLAALFHKLRGCVRSFGLHKLPPGEVSVEVLRDIGTEVGLPARLRAAAKVTGVLGGGFTVASAIASAAPAAAVIGGVVAIAATVWQWHVPRRLGQIRWLRWMVKFDVEDRAERRE